MTAKKTAAMTLRQLQVLVSKGEGPTLEFKRSTGELKEAMQTLCGFLNGAGGTVVFGVRPDGTIIGQDVTDQTIRDIIQALGRFEPAVHIPVRRIPVRSGLDALALTADPDAGRRPYAYDGRAYERTGSSTRRMPQSAYERMILDRAHAARRWENEPAEGVTIRDIDRDEVLRVVTFARAAGRLVGPVGTRVEDILDRLKLRQGGRILQGAVVLFGKEFLPYYPQCELRMARFRGTNNAEFLDQRQIHAPAFKLLEEAQLFCQRHFPLPGKVIPGRLQRVDTPLIPPDAVREILVNALIHRDYAVAGGAVSLAIYDDRVEIWSAGTFPTGITPAMLSRKHPSIQRNPDIANVFHMAGLIEKWGRGTNRVGAMCRTAGIPAPVHEEIGGSVLVTFRIKVGTTGPAKTGPSAAVAREVSQAPVRPKSGPSQAQVRPESIVDDAHQSFEWRILAVLMQETVNRTTIAKRLGHACVSGAIKIATGSLLRKGWAEYTIPDKPKSRMQRLRITAGGEEAFRENFRPVEPSPHQ